MTTVMDAKERQRLQWDDAAAEWERRFEWYSRAFGPIFDWCLDAVEAADGARVLDVACGAGQPLFALAARVGPRGHVTGIDISPHMTAAARRRAAAERSTVAVMEMDAEALEFPDASFDAVTCACGVMFFPDARRALMEMHRVLRPGGRVAVVAWDAPPLSPFFTVAGGAVARFFPAAPPDPNAPGAFRFSDPAALAALLHAGGFDQVTIERQTVPIALASADEYWDIFTGMAAGIQSKIAQLSGGDRARLRAMVDEGLAPYVVDGRLRLAIAPLCASGRR